jgi:hypothetical protein
MEEELKELLYKKEYYLGLDNSEEIGQKTRSVLSPNEDIVIKATCIKDMDSVYHPPYTKATLIEIDTYKLLPKILMFFNDYRYSLFFLKDKLHTNIVLVLNLFLDFYYIAGNKPFDDPDTQSKIVEYIKTVRCGRKNE